MKLKKIMKLAEQAMTAATFAEEGDFSTAQSLLRESRRVLLALRNGQADPKTLRYALNTAKRINAQLDLLLVTSEGNEQRGADGRGFESFFAELRAAGISYRLIPRTGCLKEQIVRYTNQEKEIIFAVIESPAHLDADCAGRGRELSDLWRTLKCPLVVVMDGAS